MMFEHGLSCGARSGLVPAGRLAWWLFAAFACVLAVTALVLSASHGRSRALSQLDEQARVDVGLKVAHLRAVLERPRAMPLLLSQDPDVASALRPTTGNEVDRLDRKLEGIVAETQAAVIYVVRGDGMAIASSNWNQPDSFVGNDYSFRDYFRGAMANGKAEHFALGNVSKRPGLYVSERVGPRDAPLGVVVVKMEFDGIEADWREAGRPTFVTDPEGAVLITSIPSWRFMAIGPIAADRMAAIRQSLQYGQAPLETLPIRKIRPLGLDAEIDRVVLPGTTQQDYLRVSAAVPSTPWRMQYLVPSGPPLAAAALEWQLYSLVIVTPILAIAAFLLRRRERVAKAMARARAARNELELRVAQRTEDLSRARDRLEAEIAERRSAETQLQAVQQELVQANRLAILGQVAAGVAHEINQPLATIRTYADNARTLIDRDQISVARRNMETIAGLTDRIGSITDELKAFARKGRRSATPVSLAAILNGAQMLLRSRFASRIEALRVERPDGSLLVIGDQIRLEQVLINLLQNALEAVEGRPNPLVRVDIAEAGGDEVSIAVTDNGPGLAPEILDQLFIPFTTSKAAGLGLGLVISKEIVTDYGGRIDVRSSEDGACFTIHLKKATT